MPLYGSFWDSERPPLNWDSGLFWDIDTGVNGWLSLVTSEHTDKPKFTATLAGVLQPFADMIQLLYTMAAQFDLNAAIGTQLDAVGQWANVSRFIPTAVTGIYFSFDTAGLGFDQGTWWNPFSPTTQLTKLPDDAYRNLIRLVIAYNNWDGSIPAIYAAWNAVFGAKGYTLLVQDQAHMHMLYAIAGTVPDALTLAMFLAGLLTPKPAGVQIDAFMTPSVPGAPYFGFDVSNSVIAGFDSGAWGVLNPGF